MILHSSVPVSLLKVIDKFVLYPYFSGSDPYKTISLVSFDLSINISSVLFGYFIPSLLCYNYLSTADS